MTGNCNILYLGNISDIRIALKRYIKLNNIDNFLGQFIKGDIPELIRYTKTISDESDELHKSIISFNNDLDLAIQALVLKNPSLESNLDNLRKKVLEVLHIDLDESLSGSVSEFDQYIEAKTTEDIRDIHAANLGDHIKDIYGTGAYDIIKTLKENFGDDITSSAYWNINSGSVILKNNVILNQNFQNIKNKYYKQIVQYLKLSFPNIKEILDLKESMTENGKFIGSEYFDTINKFYRYIKTMDSYYDTLLQDLSNKINDTLKIDKIKTYVKMINTLMLDENFSRIVGNKYNNKKLSNLRNVLYEADYFSEYYIEAKRLINKHNLLDLKVDENLTVLDAISYIESLPLTLLNAVNAYTSLVHFDELLLDQFGKSFSITPNLQGIEMGDMTKYQHHLDTAHEKKGWQLSESIDSERYTANLTKQIFNQIRIFSYKTNTYQNRRVDSTKFIVASRNFLNDIIYNNILWNIPQDPNSRKRKAFDTFIRNVLDMHTNPEDRFLKVLEYLFGEELLYKNMIRKKLLTEYDLDILYSVYNTIYNKLNPNSLLSRELAAVKLNNGRIQNLVLEISGYVDRNTTMDYLETSYDPQTQQVISRVKRKYFNNIELFKTRVGINTTVNNVTLDKAKELRDKYNFKTIEQTNGYTYYQISINDDLVTLKVPNLGGKILTNDSNISYEDNSIFDRIDTIDLVSFRDKIMYGGDLTADELSLKTMLEFIDDHLDLAIISNPSYGLQVLSTYKTIYNPNGADIVGNNFMMPLMLLAMRAAYANSRYAEANGEKLGKYLESLGDKDDGIYQSFKRNERKSKLFSLRYGNVKYNIASFNDKVLELWCDAKSMLSGEASKATTKDKFGNSIPNNSVNKLGTNLPHYLNKQLDTNVNSLFFVENRRLIRSTLHDLEVTTWNGDSKSIKSFSSGELFFHAIFNKFWGNYLNTGNVIVLPTVYSDKTTFINYEINTLFDGTNDIMKNSRFKEEITQLYINSIGLSYKNIWISTKNKLQQIADLYNLDNNTNFTYKEVLRNLNEELLMRLADRLGITLELDKDYRNIKYVDPQTGKTKSGIAVNEMLEYYSEVLYSNPDTLLEFLENEKINFVKQLVSSGSYFLVLNFGDKLSYYLEDKISDKASSNNPIIETILSFYTDVDKRKAFFENWVDSKTGKLILAKQNGKSILGVNDKVKDSNVTLNPLLERFFYIEGFISNNLRMSLTGSEINHPNKAKGTLYELAKKAKNKEDFKNLGILLTENLSSILKNILNNITFVGDLLNVEEIVKNVDPVNKSTIVSALNIIYNKSLLTIANVALGTLFKRNVIIPATLQYCQQNVREGISPKTKCAVIRDEGAHVWNYRGDHENDIDSADGSAQINPFLSILENRSLGSLAVGFTKKPIWHSYDTEGGTAFLAKFATNTITNESMRMSMLSHTNLFKLFKKMTNLQWLGDVDLTESITLGKLGNGLRVADIYRWFLTSILGNSIVEENGTPTYVKTNRLLYSDAKGKISEIIGFDKTISDGMDLYYTKEIPFVKADIGNEVETKKVYHVFYDVKDSNGKITEKSRHITFDSYQKAKSFISTNEGAHTINSLFELHTALGGINCVDLDGNFSEFSNEVVVNFMNNVGNIKEGVDRKTDIVNLENYNLPLKNYHIGYALNNTAVKNGAKNINPESSWYDDTDLRYFEVDSDGLGMLMNADHDIINSTLTEFSQVIAATSAYGYTHDLCAEIFKGLALASSLASKKLLDSINYFLESNFDNTNRELAKSELYEAVGRILLVNDSIKDKESLLNIIMEAVTKIFYKSRNHGKDEYKIPFSDSNIYSEFISTLASTINKESIRRSHPGSGCVIVAGYNIAQYYEINGTKYMYDDLLKLARLDYINDLKGLFKTVQGFDGKNNTITIGENKYYLNNQPVEYLENLLLEFKLENSTVYNQPSIDNSLYSDISLYNNNLIKAYLNKHQLNATVFDDKSWYMPSDIVDIVDENKNLLKTIDLNSLDIYYKFKDGIFDTELLHNVSVKVEYKKYKYTIALNEDPNVQFVIEGERDNNGKLTGKYNIHFKTGGFNSELKRRTQWEGKKETIDDLKIRLFRAALEVLPVGSILRLSPTTEQQINERKGGLTSGSIAGYTSIINNEERRKGVNIIPIGEPYEVKYFDKDGVIHSTQVYEYKKVSQDVKPYKYRVNVTKPRNLKPSLIRWQYAIDDLGNTRYMNIFDTNVIRNAYIFPESKPKNYRKQILEVLNNLHKGIFTDREGNSQKILEGSLENTEAELIMSNIYKEKFGIEGDASLSEILNKGKDYFKLKKLNSPTNTLYDIAFLKDTGNHTLITLGEVNANNYIQELPFNNGQLTTNNKDEIVLMAGNKELFEVGKWVDYSNKVLYEDGKYIDAKTKQVMPNLDMFRLKDSDNLTSVQKKIYYITRYNVTDKIEKSNKVIYKLNTLYKIASIADFKEALGNEQDAAKQRASIINKLYLVDNYKIVLANVNKNWSEDKLNHVKSALGFILSNKYIKDSVKGLLQSLLDGIETIEDISKKSEDPELEKARKLQLLALRLENQKNYKELLLKFLDEEANNKWISFLDSLKFIASRIPAQTLQSFMTMKLVSWTKNSKNMAYVSHFLTYLLGSDYDIDKAYIMGLSYDSNGVYIGWSNLFDHYSVKTLEASKTLPVPKKIYIQNKESGENIDSLVNQLLPILDYKNNPDELIRVKAIKLFSEIIRIAELNNGNINYTGNDSRFDVLLKRLNDHEYYSIPVNIAEAAYKNVASANIYLVSHDIRNRDLAYTAISMDIMKEGANKSPKGNEAAKLNMLNPLTKYIMQYLNLVGKNVISIGANGEKVWFNTFYHWNQVLKHGTLADINRLRFKHIFKRVNGRSKGTPYEYIASHLPDLNSYDEEIRSKLLEQFEATDESLEYKYVDLLISQLLSAATDNAKELILAKINAGTNFARMYVYTMMMGLDINDIVAFMTSPVVEFIDLLSTPNIFQNENAFASATLAINASNGIIGTSRFLHGKMYIETMDSDTGAITNKPINKTSYVLLAILNSDLELVDAIRETKASLDEDFNDESKFDNLLDLMQSLILTAVKNNKYSNLDITTLFEVEDAEVNSYLEFCLTIIEKLRDIKLDYLSKAKKREETTPNYDPFEELQSDVKEFLKLYLLSSEITLVASAWLGLNLGLPTDELGIIKRLVAMSKIISDRESALGIVSRDIYKSGNSESKKDFEKNKEKLILRIQENNPTLTNIEERLDIAHENDLINNFDIIEYLKDTNGYRDKVRDYYNLIMGTINVFDMVEVNPNYKQILECFKALVVSNDTLASKSRLVNRIILDNKIENVLDLQLRGIIQYINKLNTIKYTSELVPILTKSNIEGFDSYFNNIKTNKIELDTINGLATFKHWIENEFLDWLKTEGKNPKSKLYNNSAIKHLKVIPSGDGSLLATDIDLLNPNITTVSREGYDEILRGFANLEKIEYDLGYSVIDLLQLYNIVVNDNMYGGERLTTAFKVNTSPDNILNKYLKFISELDWDDYNLIDYDNIDYLINAAPTISPFAESKHNEKFVKVTDPVQGYILKSLDRSNLYNEYNIIPASRLVSESYEDKLKRLENFMTNSPIIMPHYHNQLFMVKIIEFNGDFNNLSETEQTEIVDGIRNMLIDYSTSNKIHMYKDC